MTQNEKQEVGFRPAQVIVESANTDHSRGLYKKFYVERSDGTSAAGCKHHNCNYFVLDLTHDPHAVSAIVAYAESCRQSHPLLSADLLRWVKQKDEQERYEEARILDQIERG